MSKYVIEMVISFIYKCLNVLNNSKNNTWSVTISNGGRLPMHKIGRENKDDRMYNG